MTLLILFAPRTRLTRSMTQTAALGKTCTDALVGLGRPGILVLDFSREGVSRESAIEHAHHDIQRALPGSVIVLV